MTTLSDNRTESRLQLACDHLRQLAHHHKPGTLLPTIRTLREQLGVSNTTLNAALTALEREGILRRRQGSGIFVAEGKDQRRLLLICDPAFLLEFGSSPFWQKLIDLVKERASAQGEQFSLHFTLPQLPDTDAVTDSSALHPGIIAEIEQKRVHGVIAIGLPHPLIRWIEGKDVPVVAFAGPANYMVATAQSELIQVGVAELAGLGCKRIALWMPGADEASISGHLELFRGALAAHGRSETPLWTASEPLPTYGVSWGTEQGFRLAMRHFGTEAKRETATDGILSMDDMLTQGILMGFHQLGIVPGKDVHVATHANRNSPALLGWQHQITRIEFDPGEIVQLMFEMLQVQMEGGKPEEILTDYPLKAIQGVYRIEYLLMVRPRLIRPVAKNQAEPSLSRTQL